MKRRIISIDKSKCNGCSLCIPACRENAIGMKNGKATLLNDNDCGGHGDCLHSCPAGALDFIVRDIPGGDKEDTRKKTLPASCPGTASAVKRAAATPPPSCLRQWPVQIRLAPARAPYLDQAHLLIAADCAAYAHASFHQTFMKGRFVLIGCPKLDDADYSKKISDMLTKNDIKSVVIVRMEVPCCGGIEYAVRTALLNCQKEIPSQVVTLSVDGHILK